MRETLASTASAAAFATVAGACDGVPRKDNPTGVASTLALILVIDGKEVSRNTTTAQYGLVQVSNGK